MKIGKREMKRLHALTLYEEEARSQGFEIVAGIDEAGRGPLAGPVVAAACIIPKDIFIPKINDSKQLTDKERAEIFSYIKRENRIIYGVGIVDAQKIDKINIYQATIAAMIEACENLSLQPDYLLVDGLKLPHQRIPSLKIIKGDAKSQSIAAASIIAKETRDALMRQYHEQFPCYGFDRHKGYATEFHQQALKLHGFCSIHRMSFEPIKSMTAKTSNQLELVF